MSSPNSLELRAGPGPPIGMILFFIFSLLIVKTINLPKSLLDIGFVLVFLPLSNTINLLFCFILFSCPDKDLKKAVGLIII